MASATPYLRQICDHESRDPLSLFMALPLTVNFTTRLLWYDFDKEVEVTT